MQHKFMGLIGSKKPNLQQMRMHELEAAQIRKFELQLERDQVDAALFGCEQRIERLESEANSTEVKVERLQRAANFGK